MQELKFEQIENIAGGECCCSCSKEIMYPAEGEGCFELCCYVRGAQSYGGTNSTQQCNNYKGILNIHPVLETPCPPQNHHVLHSAVNGGGEGFLPICGG